MFDVRLCIEPLPDAKRVAGLLVTDEERHTAESFGSERRRAEYLIWRHIVRRELGEDTEIGYSPTGSPILKNRSNLHLGVSHSRDFAAVIMSPRNCAVDIECLSRNFSTAAPRYITSDEAQLTDDPRLKALLWCAKETLYKYSGRLGLDLLKDIRIEKVDFDRKTVTGRICDDDAVELHFIQYRDNLVVYIG